MHPFLVVYCCFRRITCKRKNEMIMHTCVKSSSTLVRTLKVKRIRAARWPFPFQRIWLYYQQNLYLFSNLFYQNLREMWCSTAKKQKHVYWPINISIENLIFFVLYHVCLLYLIFVVNQIFYYQLWFKTCFNLYRSRIVVVFFLSMNTFLLLARGTQKHKLRNKFPKISEDFV